MPGSDASLEWLWFSDDELLHTPLAIDPDVRRESRRPVFRPGLASAVRLHLEGAPDQALNELQPAVAAADSDALLLAGQIRFEIGRYEEAAAAFGQLALGFPGNRIAGFNQGLALARLGKWAPAIECLQRAAVRDPERFEIWFVLGVCLLGERRGEEACACFERVLRLRAEYVPAMFGHAVALQLMREYRRALAIYGRLLEARPDSVQLLSNALAARIAVKDDAAACELARRILVVDREHSGALAALASAAIERGDFTEASRWCSSLAEAVPGAPGNWLNFAVCLERSERHAEAIAAYDRALALASDDLTALERRARCLLRMREWDAARCAFARCVELADSNLALKAAATDALVLIAMEQNDFEQALRLYEQSGVRDTGVLYTLAWRCHDDARPDEARRMYCDILEREPEHAEALFNLGRILQSRGDTAEAAQLLASALRIAPALARALYCRPLTRQ